MTQVAILKPVPKNKTPPGKTTRKTFKGPVTKGTSSAPELKHAYEVKKTNQTVSAQSAKMSTPIDQDQITIVKTGKPVKPAPKTKPVKKVH
jgi:hypothetical protein